MNFVVRSAKVEDRDQLISLARQFTLLSLPADKKFIQKKIEISIASFSGELETEKAKFLFVIEDLENGLVAGCSQIAAKHGTPKAPNYSFEVIKKELFSRSLGSGFIHQILRLKANIDGPTEIGGLVVDRGYRRRPEKIGKIISLIRFLYIAALPEKFQQMIHCEMAPPLTDEGRSEFWESLGRRFTGMPYWEADALSQQNKEFIESLFPTEDVYLCLLDSKARLVLGRVSEETRPALHMLEEIGFKYIFEVDPFDGGPHLQASCNDIPLIQLTETLIVEKNQNTKFEKFGLIGKVRDGKFIGGMSLYSKDNDSVFLPQRSWETLKLKAKDKIIITPVD